MARARFRETRVRGCLQACAALRSADAARRSELLSRTAHDRWVVQSGHLMLVVPYSHVSEEAVIRKFLHRPRCQAASTPMAAARPRRLPKIGFTCMDDTSPFDVPCCRAHFSGGAWARAKRKRRANMCTSVWGRIRE